ncbi:hypothetical protein SANTM175S_00191 [Streptomyces antimycoticus]
MIACNRSAVAGSSLSIWSWWVRRVSTVVRRRVVTRSTTVLTFTSPAGNAGSVVVAATVSERPSGTVESAHALGDGVGRLPGVVHDLIQLQMQVPEVVADQVPVGLLSLEVQFDEVHHDLLQRLGELR